MDGFPFFWVKLSFPNPVQMGQCAEPNKKADAAP
jgi:hypothetical protein